MQHFRAEALKERGDSHVLLQSITVPGQERVDLAFTAFVDKSYCFIASTGTPFSEQVDAKRWMLRKDRRGFQKYVKEDVLIPISLAAYREGMGSVDRLDQLRVATEVNHRAPRWYMRVFFSLLNISIIAAWLDRGEQLRKMNRIDFFYTLALELIGGRSYVERPLYIVLKRGHTHMPITRTFEGQYSCAQERERHVTSTCCPDCRYFLCIRHYADFHSRLFDRQPLLASLAAPPVRRSS